MGLDEIKKLPQWAVAKDRYWEHLKALLALFGE